MTWVDQRIAERLRNPHRRVKNKHRHICRLTCSGTVINGHCSDCDYTE